VALEAEGTQENMQNPTEVGTEVFRSALLIGDDDKTATLSAAGFELLCAAVQLRKWGAARRLSRTWITPLANAIERGQAATVDALIRRRMVAFKLAVNGVEYRRGRDDADCST